MSADQLDRYLRRLAREVEAEEAAQRRAERQRERHRREQEIIQRTAWIGAYRLAVAHYSRLCYRGRSNVLPE